MFQVLRNLINSEKAVTSGVLVLASSVMVITGELTPQEWMAYTQTVLGIYIGGKTVQGAVSTLSGRSQGDRAKENEKQARAGIEAFDKIISANDAAADAAIDAKFGVGESASDPGKKNYSASTEL